MKKGGYYIKLQCLPDLRNWIVSKVRNELASLRINFL